MRHAETLAAQQRANLAGGIATVTDGTRDITEARLRAGDISELESRTARNDAAQAAALVARSPTIARRAGLPCSG